MAQKLFTESEKTALSLCICPRFVTFSTVLLNWVSDYPVPVDAGDFRLIDREVIEVLRDSKVGDLYLRGQIARIGFRQIGIPYSRNERKFGESKFSFCTTSRLGGSMASLASRLDL